MYNIVFWPIFNNLCQAVNEIFQFLLPCVSLSFKYNLQLFCNYVLIRLPSYPKPNKFDMEMRFFTKMTWNYFVIFLVAPGKGRTRECSRTRTGIIGKQAVETDGQTRGWKEVRGVGTQLLIRMGIGDIVVSYFSRKTYVVTPHWNHLAEMAFMRDQNLCFSGIIWKIIPVICSNLEHWLRDWLIDI